ncbi:hypothetical protein JCM3765_006840 [Sporobolomyces pararoseus]
MFHKKKPPAPLRPVKREPSSSSQALGGAIPSPSVATATGVTGPSSSNSSTAAPSPLPTNSNYTDFILRSSSSSTSEWKHNVMKFVALGEKVVDPGDESMFVRPVRLNRKDPRTVRRLTDQDRERFNQRAKERAAKAAGVEMQIDGEVQGAEGDTKDGIKEEADKDGEAGDGGDEKKTKEQLDPTLVGKGTSALVTGGRARGPGGMFKKKTRRVFVASEESRRLKREEWQPWVLEDDEGQERWVGRLEGGAGEVDINGNSKGEGSSSSQQQQQNGNRASLKGWRPAANASDAGGGGSNYVAFVFGENGDEFQVVPINRWYKFNQGPKYLTLAEEEAEEEWNRQQKTKETERWVMHKRVAPPAGASSAASTSGDSTPQPSTSTSTSAPSRPNSKGAKSSSARGGSGGGNLRDRMIARSAAGIKIDEDDDVRGKPKIKTVISTNDGGTRSGGRAKGRGGGDQDDDEFDYEEDFQDDEEGIAKIDDLADEDETKELEERIRKEMRGAERPDEIPDNVDGDEDEELTGTGREIKKLVKKTDKSGAYDSDEEENPYASSDEEDDNASVTSAGRGNSSRPTSPQPGRAQSPSYSRPQSPSRAGTPISGSGSAYLAKRATSPSGRSSTSRNSSPGPSSLSKRKRTDGGSGVDSDGGDGSKRRKNGKAKSPSPGAEQIGLITKEDLIGFLKTRPNQTSTTKDVLVHFRKALKNEPKNKAAISGLVKAVADLVNGNLVLKSGL